MIKRFSRRRLTIGFLGDNFVDGFEGPIWSNAARAARELDVNLIGYASGPLPTWYRNKFDNLINTEIIDGVVAISGTLGSLSKDEDLTDFYKHYASLPMVSISRPIPNRYNLLVHNEDGIRQIVKHLIEVHHYRKLVFIGGPEMNPEANLRLKAYRETLAYYGIPYDPETVFHGNFWDDGIRAIQVFLDERKLSFDAVVAANDFTALYAIKELQRRGFRIPQDVAVTGFDDIQESRSATPSVTTVGQPLSDIGRESIKAIIALVRGESDSIMTHYLPPHLIIRQSCGCLNERELRHELPNAIDLSFVWVDKKPTVLLELAAHLSAEFLEVGQCLTIHNWAHDLVSPFENLSNIELTFLPVWERLVGQGFEHHIHITTWFTILNSLEKAIQSLPKYDSFSTKLNTLFISASQLVGMMAEHYQTTQRRNFIEQFDMIKRIYYSLNIILTDDQNLHRFLEDFMADFPKFQINSFYFSRYKDNPEKAKLNYYFNSNRILKVHIENEAFPSNQLLPGRFSLGRERCTYIVVPVFQIGFALYDVAVMDDLAFHSFFSLINNAIKLLVMTMEFLENTKELEEKVEERTRQLKEAQQQMLETAHQAGMAEVAVGVMHNVGNLLNSVNVSTEEIGNIVTHSHIESLCKANELLVAHQDHLAEYFTTDSKATLLPEFYRKIGESLVLDQQRIEKEVTQLRNKISLIHEIIRSLQEHARGNQEIKFEEETEFALIIENAIKINESGIIKNQIEVKRDFAAVEPCQIQRTKLTHILVNLIKNAVEAMSETKEKRVLSLKLFLDNRQYPTIQISDTGTGIEPANLSKIFTYGFTTKQDGHGFGLHTCANYMHEMGGSIMVSSHGPNKGAVFTLKLPKMEN